MTKVINIRDNPRVMPEDLEVKKINDTPEQRLAFLTLNLHYLSDKSIQVFNHLVCPASCVKLSERPPEVGAG